MWLFYTMALPLTLGMVGATLRFFAAPSVPLHVLVVVGYAWFCALSIVVLIPADVWTTLSGSNPRSMNYFWNWSYWSTFFLTWTIVPILQGYEDAGDFTITQRFKTSLHANLIYYSSFGAIGLLGVIILIALHKLHWGDVMSLAMACSNTFGLVTGAFLLGFGLVEIPRGLWRKADWQYRQKVLTHRIAKAALKLDDAHQELSTTVVIAQAISNQMTRRDVLRPCMDVIDQMMDDMMKENPSFKPSAGRMGENDMDYDTDERSMATLRRRLRKALNAFSRYKSEYAGLVWEALELEDTMKNYERGGTADWRFISSFHPPNSGRFARLLDQLEWLWRCILRRLLLRILALLLGTMSAALLLAEATLIPSGIDLSLFSILINSASKQEIFVQILTFLPLVYMCACTYFSVFKLGMFTFYYLAPRYTNSVSLLMICSMVSRYAPPICYNFLSLIQLSEHNKPTSFEKKMASSLRGTVEYILVRIYPLFMVIYTALIASNVFNRLADCFGSWRRFRFDNEIDNSDGCDPSGLIIIRKERTWLEQGFSVGEHVVPLARNFNNVDLENDTEAMLVPKSQLPMQNSVSQSSKPSNQREIRSQVQKDIAAKYKTQEKPNQIDSTAKYSSQNEGKGNQPDGRKAATEPAKFPARISEAPDFMEVGLNNNVQSRWNPMKFGLQDLRSNLSAKRLAPFRYFNDKPTDSAQPSTGETLDNIFAGLRIKRSHDDADIDLEPLNRRN